MREIPAADVQAQLLDEAERDEGRQQEIDNAIANITAQRKRPGKITVAELLSARDEGRKS